jgi:cadmium resistance protein CadD (predicted permease)
VLIDCNALFLLIPETLITFTLLENLLTHIIIGLTTFAITNIDDLMILSIYFANPAFKKSNIVIGQYIGVMILVGLSLFGFILGKVFEPKWIGLLGFVPIFLGIKGVVHLFKVGLTEDNSVNIEIKSKIQFINVALITIANGGDNIGVYTPLFANKPLNVVIVYVFLFIKMIGVWCALAYYFVKHPLIKNTFARYAHIILPFFLILLGIWILIESQTFSLFF